MTTRFVLPALLGYAFLTFVPAGAAAQDGEADTSSVKLSPAQLFQIADGARDAGDYATAETAYRALAENPDLEIRSEARFRLGMMLADQQKKYREAAVIFRQILDEQPDTARVRIELARMQVMLGNLGSAEREFRAAQAAGLPPEVERLVRFYAQALSAQKPFGFNLEFAIAPDSNINRATSSDTLDTIIGDFTLSEDARETSGVGLNLRGQAFVKTGIDQRAELLVRLSGGGSFYRHNEFDDYSIAVQAGPQYQSGKDRISLSALAGWRWFGRSPYTFTYGATGELVHPLGNRAQMRLNGSITHRQDKFSALRSADSYALSAGVDRAFSSRFGGSLRVHGQREVANDPGYSTTSGGVTAMLFRELGKTTAAVDLSYGRLEADRRLFLYPERRVDDRFSASVSATFRGLRIGAFAPLARLKIDNNQSTVEIYDYDRIAAEFGIAAAF